MRYRSAFISLIQSRLAQSAAKYTAFTAIDKIVPLLFLPIAVAKLSPESLGLISLFYATNLLFSTMAPLQTHGVIPTRFYKLSANDLKIYIGNALFMVLLSEIVFLTLLIPLWPTLSQMFNLPSNWLFLLIFSSLGTGLFQVAQTIHRLEDNWKLFGSMQILKTSVDIGCTLAIVLLSNEPNQLARIIPITLANSLFGVASLLFIVFSGRALFSIHKIYLKEILVFCAPLIPHSLSGWIINSSDRFFLSKYAGLDVTGKYDVAYTLGMMISLLSQSFNMAWSPYLFRILSENSNNSFAQTKKIRRLYASSILVAGVVLAVVAHVAMRLFAPPQFQTDASVIYLISAAFIAQAFYFLYVNYLLYFHKTVVLLLITGTCSVISILLSITLIPKMGMLGAAISTCVAFFSLFLLTKNAVHLLVKDS
ncbi:MAG: oligosaccharide flippase family protein [Bdellovibrio sp.]